MTKTLETHVNTQNTSANDDHIDRHESNTNTQSSKDFEHAFDEDRGESGSFELNPAPAEAHPGQAKPAHDTAAKTFPPSNYPLGMVLEACPDVRDYAQSGSIRSWPEFLASVRMLRPMLGISPHAWREAIAVLGEINAAIAVAAILQRSEHSSEATRVPGEAPGPSAIAVNGSPAIKSPGGYLRALTEKAAAGQLALGPVLMALRGQRLKAKRA